MAYAYDYEFVDGYDTYGPPGTPIRDLLLQEYNSYGGGGAGALTFQMYTTAALTGVGQALEFVNAGAANISRTLNKTLPANYKRGLAGHTFKANINSSVNQRYHGWTYTDNVTDQLSITIDGTTGTISVRRGGINGTILFTSAVSVTHNSVHYICWDIGIDDTTGYAIVWLDNIQIINISSQDTKASANAYFNVIKIAQGNSSETPTYGGAMNVVVDHSFWWCYTVTGAPDVPPLTSPVVESQAAITDDTVAWTVGPGVVGYASRVVETATAPGANRLALRKFTPGVNCTLNSVAFTPTTTSATIKYKPAVYADSAGAPAALLTTGAEVVGTTANVTQTLPVTTPQALVAGTQYWIGYITDTSQTILNADGLLLGYGAANTYTSGAPNPAPAMTAGLASSMIWGNVTGMATHYSQVDENPPLGSLSYNASATVNQEDILNFPNLSTNPLEIYTVGLKGYLQRSDAGARTVDLRTKSSATTTSGDNPGISPSTSWGFWNSYWRADPNTGVAWVYTGVNAAKHGHKIAS